MQSSLREAATYLPIKIGVSLTADPLSGKDSDQGRAPQHCPPALAGIPTQYKYMSYQHQQLMRVLVAAAISFALAVFNAALDASLLSRSVLLWSLAALILARALTPPRVRRPAVMPGPAYKRTTRRGAPSCSRLGGGVRGRPLYGTVSGGVPASLVGKWKLCAADGFRVRAGPDYPRKGQKAESAAAMYVPLGADACRCPQSLSHAAANLVELPQPPPGSEGGALPPLLVVAVQIPLDAPSLLQDTSDGAGILLVLYFGVTPDAQSNTARGAGTSTPAANLLMRYNARARRAAAAAVAAASAVAAAAAGPAAAATAVPSPPATAAEVTPSCAAAGAAAEVGAGVPPSHIHRTPSRHAASAKTALAFDADAELPEPSKAADKACVFKLIVGADNLDVLGLPQVLERANFKPVIIHKVAEIHAGKNYLEIDVGVHKFNYFARAGLKRCLDRVRELRIRVGCLLQGSSDAELPECLLGAVSIAQANISQIR